MEYMEQQAQMVMEGGVYSEGYRDGLRRAVEILRSGAESEEFEAKTSHKIYVAEGAKFAATILRSWANGIEIEANKS